jgi:hypothetical protein
MILAGAVTGLLPLTHTYSFAVVLLAAGGLAVMFPRWRLWSAYAVTAALLAAPQVLWIVHDSPLRAHRFIEWAPGWSKGPEPLLWFWLKNTGLFIPLVVAALLSRRTSSAAPLRRYYLAFVLLFIAPNLFRLAPRVWDNNKVLMYWYVASAPLVAFLLAEAWRRGLAARVAAGALYLSLILAGALDVWRVACGTATVMLFDADAVRFAQVVDAVAPPKAIVVRAPSVNHPVLLTGRASVLGYDRRVELHGLDTSERAAHVKCIFSGCGDARRLLDAYHIDYLVVGPPEREAFALDDRFLQSFPIVGEHAGYQLRQVPAFATTSAIAPLARPMARGESTTAATGR